MVILLTISCGFLWNRTTLTNWSYGDGFDYGTDEQWILVFFVSLLIYLAAFISPAVWGRFGVEEELRVVRGEGSGS